MSLGGTACQRLVKLAPTSAAAALQTGLAAAAPAKPQRDCEVALPCTGFKPHRLGYKWGQLSLESDPTPQANQAAQAAGLQANAAAIAAPSATDTDIKPHRLCYKPHRLR